MQPTALTPTFRSLSINATPRLVQSTYSFYEKDQETHRNPEKECFMCRQANIYIQPIGMQQERRVARRHPPPLTRAQIEELSEKKHLTKREVRLLLQCYFPEIKNVKYFQLHKYHSCCYDAKHLNLCKNHITALQHERELFPNRKDDKQKNRVSFVRIKIEPTKGIPTRFLGPTALPESLADMLINQVNRFENKKNPPSFNSTSQGVLEAYNVRRGEQSYENVISSLSERLANLDSDDDDDDDHNSDDGSDGNESQVNTPNSNIRGYQGNMKDRSRIIFEKKPQTKSEKPKSLTNGDLVVEDLDELKHLFIHEQEPSANGKSLKQLKKKKRKRRTKKHSPDHHKPKLNHWEILALDQSKKEVCGCRHHVRRLEADHVVYDWCRCKDHLHKDIKERRRSIPPPPPSTPPAPPPTPPPKPKKITRPKVQKKTVGMNTTESTTTELALAYDPNSVDYDVLEEVLYYRTSSGRLVKPEISNAFTYNNISLSKGLNHHKRLTKNSGLLSITPKDQFQNGEKNQRKGRYSSTDSPVFSNRGSASNGYTLIDTEGSSTNLQTAVLTPVLKLPNLLTTTKKGMHDDNDDDSDNIDEFTPPKYMPEIPENAPISSPIISGSNQKSSKPTYTNERPTPNFERESTILTNRRWFDQALGDQNLLTVHDGRYGLIAGVSADQHQVESQLPDNDYVESYTRKNKSNCTIS